MRHYLAITEPDWFDFQPRNPTIARIFRSIKLSENAGSGFEKMFKGWAYCYKRKPLVENEVDFYKITFYLELNEKYSENLAEKYLENIPENRLDNIKKLIINNNKISIPEIANVLKVNEKTIKRDFEKLKEKGILKRIGPDKGGHWEVIINKK